MSQRDIPDDIKADSGLALDTVAALAAIRWLLCRAIEAIDRLIEAQR
jgi:hypothetical protein